MHQMKKIGLTGGIGVGKTYIAKILQKLKIPVFNSDIEAKKCLLNNTILMEKLKLEFGKTIFKDGQLQRKILSNLIFNDKKKLNKLNSLVHPYVKESFDFWCKNQNSNIIVKEAAILYESKSHLNLDAVICVSAPFELRVKRIEERDQLNKSAINKIIDNQMSQEKKEQLSDYIIINDEKKLILPQLINIIKEME